MNRLHSSNILILSILSIAVCVATFIAYHRHPRIKPDEWLIRCPDDYDMQDWEDLGGSKIIKISKENIERAIEMLKLDSYLEIDRATAEKLAKSHLLKTGTAKFFLVRGVQYVSADTYGAFTVCMNKRNHDVHVEFVSRGNEDEATLKCPIILLLSERPGKVYVYVLADQ